MKHTEFKQIEINQHFYAGSVLTSEEYWKSGENEATDVHGNTYRIEDNEDVRVSASI